MNEHCVYCGGTGGMHTWAGSGSCPGIQNQMMGGQDPMANPSAWFSGDQWAIVEKLRAQDSQRIFKLLRRIQDLEGAMVYHRNFLPQPLKAQAEAILFPNGTDTTPTF